jgi:Flp pilus assembly pilin Flp
VGNGSFPAYGCRAMDLRSWGNRVRDESGQTAVEYAIVVATTVVILTLFLAVMPDDLFGSFWSTVNGMLP